MNRLVHLKQTLIKNINDNQDYANLEFVLLDYNSKDNLEKFIKENFRQMIANKTLVYFKTHTPEYFNRSHSRNLCFKLATGDILCNLDADNFTGEHYADYINSSFKQEDTIFLASQEKGKKDHIGRICLGRNAFFNVRGYDEYMSSYGFEDYDLINRLIKAGFFRKNMDGRYLKSISHGDKLRIGNEYLLRNLYLLFISHVSEAETTILYLYRDGSLDVGNIVNNHIDDVLNKYVHKDLPYRYTLRNKGWLKGKWTLNSSNLQIIADNYHFDMQYNPWAYKLCTSDDIAVYSIKPNHSLFLYLLLFHSEISNRNRMNSSIPLKINAQGFGRDIVYKNFDYSNDIIIS